jgi:hypothetical protein
MSRAFFCGGSIALLTKTLNSLCGPLRIVLKAYRFEIPDEFGAATFCEEAAGRFGVDLWRICHAPTLSETKINRIIDATHRYPRGRSCSNTKVLSDGGSDRPALICTITERHWLHWSQI